jgi:hypothetical protein
LSRHSLAEAEVKQRRAYVAITLFQRCETTAWQASQMKDSLLIVGLTHLRIERLTAAGKF